jgi:hypothetical protein
MKLRTSGFETDHEITSQAGAAGQADCRSTGRLLPALAREGKKIKATDGLIAVWTLFRLRFVD